MEVQFLEAAEHEFVEAINWYNSESEGLGFEFSAEVRRTLVRISDFPQAWTPLSARTRRCRMNRFPYGVIYQIRDETILVVAIMHLHRNSMSWRKRLSHGDA